MKAAESSLGTGGHGIWHGEYSANAEGLIPQHTCWLETKGGVPSGTRVPGKCATLNSQASRGRNYPNYMDKAVVALHVQLRPGTVRQEPSQTLAR